LVFVLRNQGERTFSGAEIKSLTIHSLEEKSLAHPFKEQHSIQSLDPGESVEVWWKPVITTYLYGIVWVDCDLSPNNKENQIMSFQRDHITGALEKCDKPNNWGEPFYIRSRFDLSQSRTNGLIILLTTFIFIDGVFGLREMVVVPLQILRFALLFIVSWLDKLV